MYPWQPGTVHTLDTIVPHQTSGPAKSSAAAPTQWCIPLLGAHAPSVTASALHDAIVMVTPPAAPLLHHTNGRLCGAIPRPAHTTGSIGVADLPLNE